MATISSIHHSSIRDTKAITQSPQPHPMTVLMQKIAEANGIIFTLIHGDQMIKLEKDGRVHFILKFILPINRSSSTAVTRDKGATSDILKQGKIPQIRHKLFLNPGLGDWTPKSGSWPKIHDFAKKHGYDVVCKPKDGSGGRDVNRAKNGREVEQAIQKIFTSKKDVVVCGFKSIKNEYRVVVYKGRPELILRKILPVVIGDGHSSISQLIAAYLSQLSKINPEHVKELVKLISQGDLYSSQVPEKGKEIPLHWKHNGPGARTEILGGASYHEHLGNKSDDTADPLLSKLNNLALKVVHLLGISFASVDIAEIPNDPKGKTLRVLEVNSATWIDSRMDTQQTLSEQLELAIYTKIVKDLFASSKRQTSESVQLTSITLPPLPTEQKTLRLEGVIAQIGKANQWAVTSHSQGWISHLSLGEKVRLVYGYTFPLNSSTGAKICGNKPLASTILKEARVPQIRHHSFSLGDFPKSGKNSQQTDVWKKMTDMFEKYGNNIVCKPADGTGGVSVEHVTTLYEMERVVSKLLHDNKEVAFSRFMPILFEYRLIMLDDQAEVIFKKVPPFVVGDGERSLQTLAAELIKGMDPKRRDKLLQSINPAILCSDAIPNQNERVYLHWKHNLGQGAMSELLGGRSYRELRREQPEEMDPKLLRMLAIARLTMKALNVRFASVDIVEVDGETKRGKEFRVMEVNAGIMMDNLMEQQGDFGVQLATTIYTKALKLSFKEE